MPKFGVKSETRTVLCEPCALPARAIVEGNAWEEGFSVFSPPKSLDVHSLIERSFLVVDWPLLDEEEDFDEEEEEEECRLVEEEAPESPLCTTLSFSDMPTWGAWSYPGVGTSEE